MSRDVVSYVPCKLYFLCERVIIIEFNKFNYFTYIDTTISVYGIMFINSDIINKIVTSFLDLKLCCSYNYARHQLYKYDICVIECSTIRPFI